MKTLLLGSTLLAVVLVACGGARVSKGDYSAGSAAGCYETTMRVAAHYDLADFGEGGTMQLCIENEPLLTDEGTIDGTVRAGYIDACVKMTLAIVMRVTEARGLVLRPPFAGGYDVEGDLADLIVLDCEMAADARYGRD
jgi:hypothetical protein